MSEHSNPEQLRLPIFENDEPNLNYDSGLSHRERTSKAADSLRDRDARRWRELFTVWTDAHADGIDSLEIGEWLYDAMEELLYEEAEDHA